MDVKGAWDVEQYEKFKAQRAQPFYDLLAMVEPKEGMRCLDLGCGTGELTRELHQRLLAAETVGIDRSEKMLENAQTMAETGLSFELTGIEGFDDKTHYDLIFSNAALQWVPNHCELFRHYAGMLAQEGQIAIQIPCNRDHPSQTVAFELEKEAAYRGHDRSQIEINVLPLQEYAAVLDALGFKNINLRMQVYIHHLPSRDEVIEWVKGTFLLDYKKAYSEDLYERFLEEYRERLLARLPDNRPFLFTFKRILMHAVKG